MAGGDGGQGGAGLGDGHPAGHHRHQRCGGLQLVLAEARRGSNRASLLCVGRDIEYQELELERDADNVWELCADSREQPALLEDRIVFLLSAWMQDHTDFIGTPTQLAQQIDPDGREGITPRKVSRQVL